MHLLLVEDDEILADGISRALGQSHYDITQETDGLRALEQIQSGQYDGVILDLNLPTLHGTEILRRVRAQKNPIPVLILTAQDSVEDRVSGLDLGADDYITKPFALEELDARVRALLRRRQVSGQNTASIAKLTYDFAGRRAYAGRESIELSARETEILELLLKNTNRVVSKDRLLDHIGAWEKEIGLNAIEVYIHRLRKKLLPAGIEFHTIRGLGYVLREAR
jgi:two-component system, OmpR family, response regulator